MVTDEGIQVDQPRYAMKIATKGVSSFDVREASTSRDPGMDQSITQRNDQELESSNFTYERIIGKLVFVGEDDET